MIWILTPITINLVCSSVGKVRAYPMKQFLLPNIRIGSKGELGTNPVAYNIDTVVNLIENMLILSCMLDRSIAGYSFSHSFKTV